MTKTNMDLTELLQQHDQGDLLRSIAEAVLQLMMESDVDGVISGWLLGRGYRIGILTGGAVAICGASAAMVISGSVINSVYPGWPMRVSDTVTH